MTPREWARLSSGWVFCHRTLESGLHADLTALRRRRHNESKLLKLSLNRTFAAGEIMRRQGPKVRMLESMRRADDGL